MWTRATVEYFRPATAISLLPRYVLMFSAIKKIVTKKAHNENLFNNLKFLRMPTILQTNLTRKGETFLNIEKGR